MRLDILKLAQKMILKFLLILPQKDFSYVAIKST